MSHHHENSKIYNGISLTGETVTENYLDEIWDAYDAKQPSFSNGKLVGFAAVQMALIAEDKEHLNEMYNSFFFPEEQVQKIILTPDVFSQSFIGEVGESHFGFSFDIDLFTDDQIASLRKNGMNIEFKNSVELLTPQYLFGEGLGNKYAIWDAKQDAKHTALRNGNVGGKMAIRMFAVGAIIAILGKWWLVRERERWRQYHKFAVRVTDPSVITPNKIREAQRLEEYYVKKFTEAEE